MNHPSRLELRALREAFLQTKNLNGFSRLIEEDPLDLLALAHEPAYEEFTVAKRNGEKRLIEDPVPPLKTVQRKLNDCLQAVYYFQRSPAAHGFLTACSDDALHESRNVVNNARKHLGQPWMLNMDIEDFFHAIPDERIAWIFLREPFRFDEELAQMLMRICTYKGRLPMGAPSSPILSNFAAQLLDQDIEALAASRNWTYSRYADDMTISSPAEITPDDVQLLRDYYRAHHFEPNEKKTRLMGPDDEHVVTGIRLLGDRLDLSTEFYGELGREIRHLKDINSVKGRLGVSLVDWVNDYAERIEGMIAFAEHVLGERHPKVEKARKNFAEALTKPPDFGVMSWNEWPYR
jgi:RNA-directed DNA polymerase